MMYWVLVIRLQEKALQSTGAQSKRRSRDSYSNRAYSRTQTVRNTGTPNLPLYLKRASIRTNDLDTLVYIGDLSPWQHRTARSSCQEVSTATIHRPLTLDQRHAEFPTTVTSRGRDAIEFRGYCFVTIDRGEKYRISGASATPERREHSGAIA